MNSEEEAIYTLPHHYLLYTEPNMNEKGSYEALSQATSGLKVEDDGTADRKILIAVDFGTTFSGVAWAQTRRVYILFLFLSTFLILISLVARCAVRNHPVA